jgi:oligopeptide/dipeptide ABC transporter ATP-binding protein
MSGLLEITNLSIAVEINKAYYTAVDRFSLKLNEGEILGLAGESGCGKSLTAMSIPRLLRDNIRVNGEIMFKGTDVLKSDEKAMSALRGNGISVVYQEPRSALNPLMKVGRQIEEVFTIHHRTAKRAESYRKTIEVMERVGLPNPESLYHEYPHNLSGGMKQRVVLAMAFINKPALLIADEPTTALDVTIQAQILNLILDLTKEAKSACIFISHDLGVLRQICSRLLVMYCGQVVEEGIADDVLNSPKHPYTKALLNSLPDVSKKNERLDVIKGSVSSLTARDYNGCCFYDRCDIRKPECKAKPQKLEVLDNRGLRCSVITEGI